MYILKYFAGLETGSCVKPTEKATLNENLKCLKPSLHQQECDLLSGIFQIKKRIEALKKELADLRRKRSHENSVNDLVSIQGVSLKKGLFDRSYYCGHS